jgi:hypothetical protein
MTVISDTQSTLQLTPVERPTSRSPFVALLLKDVRLASIIWMSGLVVIAILISFYIALPIFPSGVARAAGLESWQPPDVWSRVGTASPMVWVIAAVASALSAMTIAIGDSTGRTRHLLPALPISSGLAYASKLCASAIVVAIFHLIAIAIHSMAQTRAAETGVSSNLLLYAGMLSILLVWAFAAPLFARTAVGALASMALVPLSLSMACGFGGYWFARFAIERILFLTDLAPWYGKDFDLFYGAGISLAPIDAAVLSTTFIAVVAVGVTAAWRARGVVLCRQTPHRLGLARVARLFGIAVAVIVAVAIATTVRAWTTDPLIPPARKAARLLQAYSEIATSQLVEATIESRAPFRTPKRNPEAPNTPVWEQVLRASVPAEVEGGSEESNVARVLSHALFVRMAIDPNGCIASARAALAARSTRSFAQRRAAAQMLGPRTLLSLAIEELAMRERATHDISTHELSTHELSTHELSTHEPSTQEYASSSAETADLEIAIAIVELDRAQQMVLSNRNAIVILHDDEPSGAKLHALDGSNPAPYTLRAFQPGRRHPSVVDRTRAVVILTLLEAQLRSGTLVTQHPSLPHDTLSIDAETLRMARRTVERPLPELASIAGALRARIELGIPISSLHDNETLFLPASELFDWEKTDPSYALPRD